MGAKAIRKYVIDRLKRNTDAGDRVLNAKVLAHQDPMDYPIIDVFTPDEDVTGIKSEGPPVVQEVELKLEILLLVRINDTYADDLDDLRDQVRPYIDYKLGGNCHKCLFKSFRVEFNPEGAKPFAIGRLVYSVELYETEPLEPDVDPLEEIRTGWDMADPSNPIGGGTDGQIDANDVIGNLQI